MTKLILASLIAIPAFCGIQWTIPAGPYSGTETALPSAAQHAVGPATFTITGTGTPCVGDPNQLQSVLNNWWHGDTIKLTNGCTWTTIQTYSFRIMNRPGTGVFTLTSTEDAKLPPTGTRVTPAYRPLMPTLASRSDTWALTVASGVNPVTDLAIHGIAFVAAPTAAAATSVGYSLLYVGSSEPPNWVGLYPWYDTLTTSRPVAGNNYVEIADTTGFVDGAAVHVGCSYQTGTSQARMTIASHDATRLTFSGGPNGDGTLPTLASCNPYPVNSYVNQQINNIVQFPNRITVQHCLFLNPGNKVAANKMIEMNARNFVIRDNFFEGEYDYGSADGQVIYEVNAPGPGLIENNYIQGSGENIMFNGGGVPVLDRVIDDVTIRNNYLVHIPERERDGPWCITQPTTSLAKCPNSSGIANGTKNYGINNIDGDPRLVFAGRHIFPTSEWALSTGWHFYVATNTGRVGTTEPSWPASPTAKVTTVTDGEVTWLYTGGYHPTMKNNFELKGGTHIKLYQNVFDWFDSYQSAWNGSQWSSINIKAGAYALNEAWTNCYNDTSVFPQCFRGKTRWITFDGNWIRNGTGVTMMSGQPTRADYAGDYTIRNMLLTQNEVPIAYQAAWFNISSGSKYGGPCEWFRSGTMSNVVIEHVTAYRTANTSVGAFYGDACDGTATQFPGGSYRYNIVGAGYGYRGLSLGNFPTTTNWVKNIWVGGSTVGFTAGSAINYCSSSASCSETGPTGAWNTAKTFGSNQATIFHDASKGVFKTHRFNTDATRADANGLDLGADMAKIPQIRGLSNTPTDRAVLFEYSVSPAISGTPCVVEVNDKPDFWGTYAGELGPTQIYTYYGMDSDQADRYPGTAVHRYLAIGTAVPLVENTTYYYRLHCGGDSLRGTFKTLPTRTGTTELKVSKTGATAMAWGTSYSRAGNTIAGGGNGTCSSGTCTATVNRGSIVTYRLNADARTIRMVAIQ